MSVRTRSEKQQQCAQGCLIFNGLGTNAGTERGQQCTSELVRMLMRLCRFIGCQPVALGDKETLPFRFRLQQTCGRTLTIEKYQQP